MQKIDSAINQQRFAPELDSEILYDVYVTCKCFTTPPPAQKITLCNGQNFVEENGD
jgi:hypothetical protein